MALDCYNILGVMPTATPDEIRAAYRRLARLYHPDLNSGAEAEARMQAINAAYNTLSDPQLRHQHDLAIIRARQNGYAPQSRRPGPYNPSGTRSSERRQRVVVTPQTAPPAPQRGSDIAGTLFISRREAKGGTRKTFWTERLEICPRCRGSGLEPEETVVKSQCWRCSGTQQLHREMPLRAIIPPNVADGARLRLRGQGDAGRNGGVRGHAFVTIRIFPRTSLLRTAHFLLRHLT